MSTLWTPGGEHPIGSGDDPTPGRDDLSEPGDDLSPEEFNARVAELREELAKTPASAVIANHCLGLFELAALHLSLQPPQLDEAKLAIDALGLLVDGLEGQLGEDEVQLKEGLVQLRLAYVQIRGATSE